MNEDVELHLIRSFQPQRDMDDFDMDSQSQTIMHERVFFPTAHHETPSICCCTLVTAPVIVGIIEIIYMLFILFLLTIVTSSDLNLVIIYGIIIMFGVLIIFFMFLGVMLKNSSFFIPYFMWLVLWIVLYLGNLCFGVMALNLPKMLVSLIACSVYIYFSRIIYKSFIYLNGLCLSELCDL